MALNNSQYEQLLKEYDRKQFKNERERRQRREEVYNKIYGLKNIDQAIGETAVRQARKLLDGDTGARAEFRRELTDLQEQKEYLLKAAGYPADYMELRYTCPLCKDTGFINNKKCTCFKKAEMELYYKDSHFHGILEKENFSTFSEAYYDDTAIIPEEGKTNKAYMENVLASCVNYTREFRQKSGNLLFIGSTGTGKTFLANCIAAALIPQGVSVIYVTARELFDILADKVFRTDEGSNADYNYLMNCDLLIIDDLGTELANSFTQTQIFTCINERILRNRSTIITTNQKLEKIAKNYSERVFSRLFSNYQIIKLYGKDMRISIKLNGGNK